MNSTSPNVNLTIFLDDKKIPDSPVALAASRLATFQPNQTVFSLTGLSESPHHLVISLGPNSTFIFQSLTYTHDVAETSSPTDPSPSLSSPSTPSTSTQSSPSPKTESYVSYPYYCRGFEHRANSCLTKLEIRNTMSQRSRVLWEAVLVYLRCSHSVWHSVFAFDEGSRCGEIVKTTNRCTPMPPTIHPRCRAQLHLYRDTSRTLSSPLTRRHTTPRLRQAI